MNQPLSVVRSAAALSVLMIAPMWLNAASAAPAFDCARAAKTVERLICSSSGLSRYDARLSRLYATALVEAEPADARALKEKQLRWLRQRDACSTESCVRSRYAERLEELSEGSQCRLSRCSAYASTDADKRLWASVYGSDSADALHALKDGADPNVCGESEEYPLHVAASQANGSLVRALLEAGADPDVMNCPGNTPLILAAFNDDVDSATSLLDAGAYVDNPGYFSALHMAAAHGHLRTINLLLDRGADPSEFSDLDFTPLSEAANDLQVEAVELFIKRDQNHAISAGVLTDALHKAIRTYIARSPTEDEESRGLKIAELLIRHGADVNGESADGLTPLRRARIYRQARLASFLESMGAKP